MNQSKFISANYRLKNGKYKGKSLLEVSQIDTGFINWFISKGYIITGMESFMIKKREDDLKSYMLWKNSMFVNYAFDIKMVYAKLEDNKYIIACKDTGLCVTCNNLKEGKEQLKKEYNEIFKTSNNFNTIR